MKRILVAATVLLGLGVGFAATAQARDDYERDDWFATMHSVPPPAVMERNLGREQVTEGRNAAVPVPRHSTHAVHHVKHPKQVEHGSGY